MWQPLATAVLIAIVPGQLSAQTLWRVDAGNPPGTDFLDVPEAVAAAAPGDVILVGLESGVFYTAPTIDKPLTLVSDPEPVPGSVALPSLLGTLRIEGVTGALPVRVDGFGVAGALPDEPALVVRGCDAPVLLQGLSIEPAAPSAALGVTRDAVRIEDSGPVVLTRSGIDSFGGFVFNEPGYRGLHAVDSELFLFRSEVDGADGMNAYFLGGSIGVVQASDGMAAAVVGGGRLFLSDASVRGGRGGNGLLSSGCNPPGDGGDALVVSGGASVVRIDSVIVGRPAGSPGTGCPSGTDGVAFVNGGGSLQPLPGPAPGVDPYRLIWRAGDVATYVFEGPPGQLVTLAVSTVVAPLELPILPGVLLPLPTAPLDLGAIPGTGELPLSFTVPALPPGVDVRVLQLQAVHLDLLLGAARLGPPLNAVWVAAGP